MSAEIERIAQKLPKENPAHAEFARTLAQLAKLGREIGIPEEVAETVIFEASPSVEKPVSYSDLVASALQLPDTENTNSLHELAEQFHQVLGGSLPDNTKLSQIFLNKEAKVPLLIKGQYHKTLNALTLKNITTVGEIRSLHPDYLESIRNIGPLGREFITEAFKPVPQEKEE